jgi:hypothetical protein
MHNHVQGKYAGTLCTYKYYFARQLRRQQQCMPARPRTHNNTTTTTTKKKTTTTTTTAPRACWKIASARGPWDSPVLFCHTLPLRRVRRAVVHAEVLDVVVPAGKTKHRTAATQTKRRRPPPPSPPPPPPRQRGATANGAASCTVKPRCAQQFKIERGARCGKGRQLSCGNWRQMAGVPTQGTSRRGGR